MTKGEGILLTEVLGADFAYIGTRFIPSVESQAKERYKEMIVESSIEDITYTDAFSGINANYLVPSIVNTGLDPSNLQKKDKIDFSERQKDVKAWKDIWGAGQGVGSITKIQTVAEIVNELRRDYERAIGKVFQKREEYSK
ncbi:NAD(P)H-dependent flavin oxidoreductase [Oceanobacillus salinisoli]|uniref:NAD(P)H-dependent flavin oxidoreductase n=1 Tax=Oceanobacillus salinisoli TaxID=2678611 RepID=UPI002F35FEBC